MILKNVLPFENYVLTTRLSADEVLKRVAANIQQKQAFSFSTFSRNYTKPYTGQITGTTFKMSRNIYYRNSFLPIITGFTDISGTKPSFQVLVEDQLLDVLLMSVVLTDSMLVLQLK